MREDAIRRYAPLLAGPTREALDHEHSYKLRDVAEARPNVEEALAGARPWSGVFVGPARKVLTHHIATNQYAQRGMAAILASDEEVLDAMVRAIWHDDDLVAASVALDTIVDGQVPVPDLKAYRGRGSRASALSLFYLLKDPINHPIYRPGHVGGAIKVLGGRLEKTTPAALLTDFYRYLDELIPLFSEHGLELRDRLDAQGAMWLLLGLARDYEASLAGAAAAAD